MKATGGGEDIDRDAHSEGDGRREVPVPRHRIIRADAEGMMWEEIYCPVQDQMKIEIRINAKLIPSDHWAIRWLDEYCT